MRKFSLSHNAPSIRALGNLRVEIEKYDYLVIGFTYDFNPHCEPYCS